MEKVIVAFEGEKTCRRVKEILESSGTALCLLCRSGDQVRRGVYKHHIATIVCGYKLGEESAEEVLADLPSACSMLVLALPDRLELLRGDNLFRLSAPATRNELTEAVRTLLQVGGPGAGELRPRRSQEEEELILCAKRLLMERYGMTEESAHRFLQKKSMDNGVRLARTARLVLGGE